VTDVLQIGPLGVAPWSSDWLWSLPLIAWTVVFHSFGLGLVGRGVALLLQTFGRTRIPYWLSILVMGGSAMSATILHGFEGGMWSLAYLRLGALPDMRSATLYSLNAMTTYGHADLHLAPHWQLMGALEALNGWILFGLSAAFLFTIIQRVWPHVQSPASRN
jgi:hypothetical protein